jgi:hypothetical protein
VHGTVAPVRAEARVIRPIGPARGIALASRTSLVLARLGVEDVAPGVAELLQPLPFLRVVARLRLLRLQVGEAARVLRVRERAQRRDLRGVLLFLGPEVAALARIERDVVELATADEVAAVARAVEGRLLRMGAARIEDELPALRARAEDQVLPLRPGDLAAAVLGAREPVQQPANEIPSVAARRAAPAGSARSSSVGSRSTFWMRSFRRPATTPGPRTTSGIRSTES